MARRRRHQQAAGGRGAAVSRGPTAPAQPFQTLLTQAAQCLSAGRFAQASELCQRVLQLRAGEPNALHMMGVAALQSGRPEEAAAHLHQAARGDRRNPDLLCNLAGALLTLGRTSEGRSALERALRLAPSHPQAHYNMGLLELHRGNFALAKRHLERTLKVAPQHLDALNSLGVAQTQTGETEAAVESFRAVLARHPRHGNARLNLANALVELDRADEALAEFETLLAAEPGAAPVHFHHALALAKAQRRPEAIAAYRRAIELRPDYAEAHCNLNQMLSETGALDAALQHIEQAMRLRPGDPYVMTNAALTLSQMMQADAAMRLYEQILAAAPADREANLGMVAQLQNVGRFDDAAAFVARARSAIDDPVTRALLTSRQLVSRKSLEGDEEARLEELADDPALESRDRAAIHLALGGLNDARGRHDAAFAHYSAGAALRRAEYDYSPDAHDAEVDVIIEAFDKALLQRLAEFGSDSARPIFVLGMPRSGTTLVEQILASHDDVTAAGELPDLSYALEQELAFEHGGTPFPRCFVDIRRAEAEAIQDAYLERLRRLSDGARHVVDKMPANYLYLGAIAVLFPQARVVHCRRRPEATALSIYFQDFTTYHPYAWDLYEVGRRHRSYERLMAHWQSILPRPAFALDYERLVADQEQVSRELLAHCDLEWQDAVLDFTATKRSVRTASNWQVRQRMYAHAVDGWRNYDAHLAPLRAGLAGAPRPSGP